MSLDVVVYVDLSGRSAFDEWFARLDPQAATEVSVALYRIAAGNLGDVKPVGRGVLERRIHHGPGYRLYFGRDGDRLIVLLGGGFKQKQQDDIAAARDAWREYQTRRRGHRPSTQER